MSDHILMERGSERMNVPPDKVQKYLEDGWNIVQKAVPELQPVTVAAPQPQAESEAIVPDKAAKKSK